MTHQVDTLLCNKERLAGWQADSAYDYSRELLEPENNVFKWLMDKFEELIAIILGRAFAETYTEWVFIVLFALVLLSILWFVLKKKTGLFGRSSGKRVDYAVLADTIYGIDFEAVIAAALANSDYREAVRFLYLKALKELNGSQTIDWQPYKTPTEYIYEVPPDSGRDTFRRFTNRFLLVRYGNFEATEPLFEEMKTLWAQMKEGGEA